jgi:hypothetical protein
MAEFRPDKLTPVSIRGLDAALAVAYPESARGVRDILLAHVWGETGGVHCHCHNIGNAKSSDGDGRDWTMFACGEEVPEITAEREESAHPGLVDIRKRYVASNGKRMASVWLKPPHPWTRFRAFASLAEGATDHLRLLQTPRYREAWEALHRCSVDDYSRELKEAGYYTADAGAYAALLRGTLQLVTRELGGKPTLRLGDRGDYVRAWQRIVGATPDGVFGPRTRMLTKDWQLAHRLTADGIVGPMTWRAAK